MKLILITFFCAFLTEALATEVNEGKPMYCRGASVSEVRIAGCVAEPCTIKTGVKLPVELDFEFVKPLDTSFIQFSVFIRHWESGNSVWGSQLASETSCTALKIPMCPAKAGLSHTLISSIFVDPQSKDTLTEVTSGTTPTFWTVNPVIIRHSGELSQSVCHFSVKLNIIG